MQEVNGAGFANPTAHCAQGFGLIEAHSSRNGTKIKYADIDPKEGERANHSFKNRC